MATKRILLTFCNPLLDISTPVPAALLTRFRLKPNDAILAGPDQAGLVEELGTSYGVNIKYFAAGAGMNVTRAAQWLLPVGSTVYSGCIGRDAFAERLKEQAAKDGVRFEYMLDDGLPTGTCACLLTGGNRSLVASLDAANRYHVDHLSTPAMQQFMSEASLIYVTGFFVGVSFDSIRKLVALARNSCDKQLAFNLSSPFVPLTFRSELAELLPNVDFLFGNESEAKAYAESVDLVYKSIEDIAQHLAQNIRGTVVITQGSAPTIVASPAIAGSGEAFKQYTVNPVENIVDTTGAGDAFVGGFLAAVLLGKSVDVAVDAGHRLAAQIIQQMGTGFPTSRPTNFFD